MHIFVGNVTYIMDFLIMDDIGSALDPYLSHVMLGKPFVEVSNMTYDPSIGIVKFKDGVNKFAYQIPHKIEQFPLLPNIKKDHKQSIYFRNNEDKIREVDYVMKKILGFYKECLELGNEYKTNKDGSSSVTEEGVIVKVDVLGVMFDVHIHKLGSWSTNIIDDSLDTSSSFDVNDIDKVADSFEQNPLDELNDLYDNFNELEKEVKKRQTTKKITRTVFMTTGHNKKMVEDETNPARSSNEGISSNLSRPYGFKNLKRSPSHITGMERVCLAGCLAGCDYPVGRHDRSAFSSIVVSCSPFLSFLRPIRKFRETLAEGALHLGSERDRVVADLTPEEKERYKADIREMNILLQGLPKYTYTLINHYTNAKDIWDNVKILLEGSELTKDERESQLYDEFEHFR
uniref:Retrotransposon Orf1 n=1 Tax=Tanacetum cinerariifolium TaxID=118510 RepID=A0A6L2KMC5_TANCI|nr:retrotransposon Orf1 [Tanacetum cinerariifolium]